MKISFFFGAGAEIGYGLPSGGKFALDIFSVNYNKYKKEFKKELKSISPISYYAHQWLPIGFADKNINVFGKRDFANLIESSLEYKRNDIINFIKEFDAEFLKSAASIFGDCFEADFYSKFRDELGEDIGDTRYEGGVYINRDLSSEIDIFSSNFYCGALTVLNKSTDNSGQLKRYTASFLQIIVGVYGRDLVEKLNDGIIQGDHADSLPILEEITGLFSLDLNKVGVTALDLITSKNDFGTTSLNDKKISDIYCLTLGKMLENLFEKVLDYQGLIDSHFRYLFSPKNNWGKFTKMVIFLKAARDYIYSCCPSDKNIVCDGYYHDIVSDKYSDIEFLSVGTSNYNSIVGDVLKHSVDNIYYLNGGVDDYYDPYTNSIVNKEAVEGGHIHVPFMLTQSGVKPLTNINMSRRYVDLYNHFRCSDITIIVGFGFNSDDGHINGMFRELVREENKIFIVTVGDIEKEYNIKKLYQERLRLDSDDMNKVFIVLVDGKTRKTKCGKLWIDKIKDVYESDGKL